MNRPTAWERVKVDVESGRLWKARDRLLGMFAASPADQKVLDHLGEIYLQMGDLPQAGRYWFLTDRDDEMARDARAALYERFGRDPLSLARNIPVRAAVDSYPDSVRDRLTELGAGLPPGTASSVPAYRPSMADRVLGTGCAVGAVIVAVGGWVFGVVTLIDDYGNTPPAIVVGAVFVVLLLASVVWAANKRSRERRAAKKIVIEEKT